MIQCDKGNVSLAGNIIDMLSELTVIMIAINDAFIDEGMPAERAKQLILESEAYAFEGGYAETADDSAKLHKEVNGIYAIFNQNQNGKDDK